VNQALAQNRNGLLPGCTETSNNCDESFVDDFAKRAYRRTLSAQETNDLRAQFNSEYTNGGGATAFNEGMKLVMRTALMMPQFLYKSEMGVAEGGNFRLSQHEIASVLSYMFWGTMPDATLMSAADSGQLTTAAQLRTQAQRLLADSKARAHVVRFGEQWLVAGPGDIGVKDANIFPSFNTSIREAMTEELRTFLEHVAFDSSGKLDELFEADYVFVNNTLANYYGISGVNGSNMQKVIDPAGNLGGILTMGAVMAAHGHQNESAPFPRGNFIRGHIMCQQLPDPPEDLDTSFPPPNPDETTRQRFEARVQSPACQECHQYLNGPGFAMEAFDGAGKFRTTDNGSPVDVFSSILALNNLVDTDTTNVSGGQELQTLLATATSVRSCYPRQAFRFARGYAESGDDQNTINNLVLAFQASNYDLLELMVSLTQLETFSLRRAQ